MPCSIEVIIIIMGETSRKEKKYAIDLTLFKYVGFYQMVDPNSPRIFNWNVYNVVHIALVIVTSSITIFGIPGVLFRADRSIENSLKDMPLMFYIACITVGNMKVLTIIYHSDQIWRLLDVASESFLTSKHCRTKYHRLVECGGRYAKIFPWYFFLFFMTGFSWITMPVIVNRGQPDDYGNYSTPAHRRDDHVPKLNVVNLRYPISGETYNQFYGPLYAMEGVMCAYGAFGLVGFDLYLIAVLQLMSVQYDVISSAYEGLQFEADSGNGQFEQSSSCRRNDLPFLTMYRDYRLSAIHPQF